MHGQFHCKILENGVPLKKVDVNLCLLCKIDVPLSQTLKWTLGNGMYLFLVPLLLWRHLFLGMLEQTGCVAKVT